MRSKYCESLLSDVNKLNEKFDKFVKGNVIQLIIVQRTGYYQDFHDVVAHYVCDVNFSGDGHRSDSSNWEYLVYPSFKRDLEIDINGTKLHAVLELELHGNRFMINQFSSYIFVPKDEVRKIFPKIEECTYWPNGYNVGEYDVGGHDYYASAILIKAEEVVNLTNKGWIEEPPI